MLKNIRIVLIETTHPGNIGAVARAMKNMGLEQLFLVSPACYPNAEATARASGADDLLQRARVVDDLDQALEGCRLVVGASARMRSVQWPQIEPRECAGLLRQEAQQGEVAILFGRESSGLRNRELDHCQYLVHIPSNPEYSSLNLSQAVQVLSYEMRLAAQESEVDREEARDLVPAEDMERFFGHLERTLVNIRFSDPRQSNRLQRRLRRLFFRARPDREEMNILRGILSAAEAAAKVDDPEY